ncbi:hypothetical protein CPC16_007592 [Podila verticillata]|nr:hypothetical protein BGZ59_002512 [Podila verticillata]KAF9386311.1 hypothetical protein CPC16_007592 [Podila verticillata]KFH72206.1 hypothetical protein MVEG_02497 [Podila verticillata NRRL 6337]
MASPNALKQRHQKQASDQRPSSTHDFAKDFPQKAHSSFSSLKTVFTAWGMFVGFLVLLCLISYQLHYTLPTPVIESSDPAGLPQFSEQNARKIVRHLSTNIGYRVVGTEQELETKQYLIKELSDLKEQARVHGLRGAEDLPQFDMWVQVGDGSHRFDFMSKGKYCTFVSCRIICWA